MQYIIMSGGKGTRWNNSLGITKQEIMIDGERLIDRTVRLIKERTDDKIYILSDNKKHENDNATRILSKYNDYFHQKYAYEYLNDATTFLYGDTYYTDELMDTIVNKTTGNFAFFGTEKAIVGLKVFNIELFKKIIDKMPDKEISLYHALDCVSELREFIGVGDSFKNINSYDDYVELIEKQKIVKK